MASILKQVKLNGLRSPRRAPLPCAWGHAPLHLGRAGRLFNRARQPL